MTSPSPEALAKARETLEAYLNWHAADPEGKTVSERHEGLTRFIAKALDEARREEREACAQIADEYPAGPWTNQRTGGVSWHCTKLGIAEAIRARESS